MKTIGVTVSDHDLDFIMADIDVDEDGEIGYEGKVLVGMLFLGSFCNFGGGFMLWGNIRRRQ